MPSVRPFVAGLSSIDEKSMSSKRGRSKVALSGGIGSPSFGLEFTFNMTLWCSSVSTLFFTTIDIVNSRQSTEQQGPGDSIVALRQNTVLLVRIEVSGFHVPENTRFAAKAMLGVLF
mmetsp:Transcript_12234/g.18633  ORF Transcript_12234/g.18633 Transcript_12234/m.18633 type:complete len:117 (-) Transcript_12234:182-532(-)